MANQNGRFLANLWTEYCQRCSIYPMRYLATKLHFSERVWWFFWIGMAILASSLSMAQLYDQWKRTPVVISYSHNLFPVWAVPFPAITVCPMARARVELFNSSDVYDRIDAEGINNIEYVRLRALLHVCPMMSEYYEFNDTLAVNYVQILQNIAIPFDSLYGGCKFRKYFIDCRTYWSRTITDGGICYTFNAIDSDDLLRTDNLHREYKYSNSYLDSRNWTLERGYSDRFELKTYPLRPVGGGLTTGLMIALKTRKVDMDYFCEGPVVGYKIAIHAPDEIPSVQNKFYRLSHQSRLSIIVKPELTATYPELRKHHHTRRQCYFNDERYLRYFKIYNKENCLQECISNLTAQECGCVGFHSPRSADVPICDGQDLYCPEWSIEKFIRKMDYSHRNLELEDLCGCLPACTTLKYGVEISSFPWHYNAFSRALNSPIELYEGWEPATLVIAFKSKYMLAMRRQELFGVSEMLAKFGGLFALAMGSSVISMLEVVYYCIIRPWRNDYPASRATRRLFPWTP
ncbi:pickpocket protein 28-like [Armigeres subalbatus]|uniref:pickpocket protein 28-like n=1 Tax=Armigeres subalbatus TaxID=124917 RepID=UPI002ED36B92